MTNKLLSLYYYVVPIVLHFMKLTTIVSSFMLTAFFTTKAAESYGQVNLQAKIYLYEQDLTLKAALKMLSKAANVDFAYNSRALPLRERVNISAGSQTLEAALQQITQQLGLTYRVLGESVLIEASRKWRNPLPMPQQFMAADTGIVKRQQHTVTGTILSATDSTTLSGATILIKGAKSGAKSDQNGRFNIPASPTSTSLVISFMGYESQALKIDPATTQLGSIYLQKMETTLEEAVVNAGYYTVKEREKTGSIARITSATIEKQPVLNVLEALKGQLPGVDIQQYSGEIGGRINIRIRGQNSLRNTTSGENDPLYILDGVPYSSAPLRQQGNGNNSLGNPLNSLNPDDISSIEVLKDADATAIYGSRGSNGVVLITTKGGVPGKSRIHMDVSAGVGGIRKFMDLLNTQQYLEMRKEAFTNNPAYKPSSINAPDLLLYDSTRYTNWQDVLLGGTANNLDSKISFSGGNADINYLMSGGYLQQKNVYPGDFGYKKGSGHLGLNIGNDKDRFKAHIAITYSLDKNDLPEGTTNLTNSALTLAPNAPEMLKENGAINWEDGLYTDNPMIYLSRPYNHNTQNSNMQAMLGYKLSESLDLRVNIGYNHLRSNERQLDPASSWNPLYNPTSGITFIENTSTSWNVEPQLNWRRDLFNGKLEGLVGATSQLNDIDGQYITGSGFINEQLMYNLALATVLNAQSGRSSQYRYLAAYTRINYSYRDRYFLNITARRDGSSRFGPGKRWGNFGAIGAAWIFSQGQFINSRFPWLSFGKIRASYGTSGSDQIDDYGYMATYTISTALPYQFAKVAPARIANADYHWETNKKFEAALELSFIDDRINASAAWYRNRSGNQLVGYRLPSMSGFNTVQYNMPATVQNTGWEMTLNTVIKKTAAFSWTASCNLTLPSRKLLSYPGIENSSYSTTYQVGKSMDIGRQYIFDGVDRETGIYSLLDVDGSGDLSDGDKVWREKPGIMYGGIQNQLAFGQFDFSLFVQFDRRERQYTQAFSSPGLGVGNEPIGVMDRWQKPGDNTSVQKFWAGTGVPFTTYNQIPTASDAWYEKTTFLRINNITIGWNCPSSWLNKLGIEGLRLSAHGQNLWVTDSKNRFEPDITYNQLPPLRMITGGIQLTL